MPTHKHLLIRAEVKHPITSERELNKWLRNLVNVIDMKIVRGPYANYIEMPGNRGVTGMVMIETSHIAFHAWDEKRPSLVQCDVYSCAEFSISDVLAQLNMMEPVKIEYMVLDREHELTYKNPEAHVV